MISSSEATHDSAGGSPDTVLEIVVDILENEGYDAVQLREVARRGKTSLSTIYKRYANRDELILAALETWMEQHRYSGVARRSRHPQESLHTALMGLLRIIFEPWEEHPGMLTAYFRARAAPGGQRLVRQGLDVVVPAALEVLADVDDEFIADLDTIISSLVFGLLGRFTAGEIAVTEIVPTLERTVFWLTSGYEASHTRPPGPGSGPARSVAAEQLR